MMKVTPIELAKELDGLIKAQIMDPVLVLGKSGIGKSAIVEQVGARHSMPVHDVRWGQLAPVDARGVPGINRETNKTEFFPPDFWPDKGPCIIHLDEFNMATPAMMGLGQQLLLSRKFGNWSAKPDMFIWSSGNQKTDFAAVNEIPAPVNNRLAHYELQQDLDTWEVWAYANNIEGAIIGFLKKRSELLHKFNAEERAWPSPRSWEMADRRLKARMSIVPVVGDSVASEFDTHLLMLRDMPNLDLIVAGRGDRIEFPEEPSLAYVTLAELVRHAMVSWSTFTNVFRWLSAKTDKAPEWTSMFVMDVLRILTSNDKKKKSEYLQNLMQMPEAKAFVDRHTQLVGA